MQLPSLHDAELTGIVQISRTQLRLQFQCPDGRALHLNCIGVTWCRVIDFALQNVISHLIVDDNKSASDGLETRMRWLHSWSDTGPWTKTGYLEQVCSRIAAGELVAIRAVPSAGAEFAVICEAIAIEWA